MKYNIPVNIEKYKRGRFYLVLRTLGEGSGGRLGPRKLKGYKSFSEGISAVSWQLSLINSKFIIIIISYSLRPRLNIKFCLG